ncbi:hypothetical protein FXO38_27854 [Capsicum annuum]|uniref:Reverse transcriptase/retrotransposon-derived protein RNase H-like domain-containing protein n=1 Tax=Capsicum annuum TaxID=4072 RepID=A0A2G2Y8H4_CAPAN|nr:hypothetical protein FXO38_27854 [Capsicum annuum]PHT66057.1 hypothetical protein T459_30482 [Capsicum annuum]
MVLGVQWLYELGDIKFNFKLLTMEFQHHSKLLSLKGVTPNLKMIDYDSVLKGSTDQVQLFMIKAYASGPAKQSVRSSSTEDRIVQAVLHDYLDLFGEPTKLPPSRAMFDYHIPLLDGATTLNHRPYRESKCVFAAAEVEYLGHFISAAGVATDNKKIQAVKEWPIPRTIKQLRGFLGLAGYYRRFIRGYGVISKALNDPLKDSFVWTDEATQAFVALKEALTSAPLLTLPDFTIPFTVETDVCDVGVGAVLMQLGKRIAYLSIGLAPKHQTLSVYDKELLALVISVPKWSQYLRYNPFIIKTDQKALKFLLEQKLHTGSQLKWVTKLLNSILILNTKRDEIIKWLMLYLDYPLVN